MKLITARSLFRDTIKELYPINETDFYFKMILSSLLEIDPIAIALDPNLILANAAMKKYKK